MTTALCEEEKDRMIPCYRFVASALGAVTRLVTVSCTPLERNRIRVGKERARGVVVSARLT